MSMGIEMVIGLSCLVSVISFVVTAGIWISYLREFQGAHLSCQYR